MTDYWRWGILTIAFIVMALFFLFVNLKTGVGAPILKRTSYYAMWLCLLGVAWCFASFAGSVLDA